MATTSPRTARSRRAAGAGVLANDDDPDNDALTAVLGTGPSHAQSFDLNADGSFTYVPDPDFNGGDSFTYHASDGTLSSGTVTVTITVNAVNDAPSFVSGGDVSVNAAAVRSVRHGRRGAPAPPMKAPRR